MKRLDRWSGIFWVVFAAAVCVRAYQIGLGDMHNPGPGFLFFGSGAILAGLAILVLVSAFRDPASAKGNEVTFGRVHWWKVAAVIVALVGYGLAMEPVGFVISTALFIGFLLASIGAKRWTVVVTVSLISTTLIYVLFVVLLQSSMPKGFLGI